MKFISSFVFAISSFHAALAYTQKDREEAINYVTKELGCPMIEAWNAMTPKHVKTISTLYHTTLADGAFEHFSARDLEVIYTAVSAVNNCEMCMAFFSAAIGEAKTLSKEETEEIMAGGLPVDPKMRALVIGAKYALAHKGIILPREKVHLETFGISGEKLTELIFAAGFMNAVNMNYVHLISEGLEVEEFLQEAGPFSKTVYLKEEL